jgi:hypothetical protein
VPIIALSLHAADQGIGSLIIEIAIGPEGLCTLLVFDDSRSDRQKVLLSLGA